jgi:hypothetical protein
LHNINSYDSPRIIIQIDDEPNLVCRKINTNFEINQDYVLTLNSPIDDFEIIEKFD